MNTGELLVDIIKTGTVALIGCKVSKAIGQKEISELISGTGWIVCGVDIVLIIVPVCNWIMEFTKTVGNTVKLLNQWGIAVDKFLHFGG